MNEVYNIIVSIISLCDLGYIFGEFLNELKKNCTQIDWRKKDRKIEEKEKFNKESKMLFCCDRAEGFKIIKSGF